MLSLKKYSHSAQSSALAIQLACGKCIADWKYICTTSFANRIIICPCIMSSAWLFISLLSSDDVYLNPGPASSTSISDHFRDSPGSYNMLHLLIDQIDYHPVADYREG